MCVLFLSRKSSLSLPPSLSLEKEREREKEKEREKKRERKREREREREEDATMMHRIACLHPSYNQRGVGKGGGTCVGGLLG